MPKRIWLVYVTLCVTLALGMAIPLAIIVPAARRAALRQNRSNNLKQLGIALHNFDDTYRRLPSTVRTDKQGRPLSSWRFQILPFVEAIMIDIDYDARWDDPVNRWLTYRDFHVYTWRADDPIPRRLHTNVVAITGPGTAFEEGRNVRLEEIDPDTILAISIADADFFWAEPGDLSIDQVPASVTQGVEGDGAHVLFADGSVWPMRPFVPLDDLKKFFTIEGAKQYDREQVLRPYAH